MPHLYRVQCPAMMAYTTRDAKTVFLTKLVTVLWKLVFCQLSDYVTSRITWLYVQW